MTSRRSTCRVWRWTTTRARLDNHHEVRFEGEDGYLRRLDHQHRESPYCSTKSGNEYWPAMGDLGLVGWGESHWKYSRMNLCVSTLVHSPNNKTRATPTNGYSYFQGKPIARRIAYLHTEHHLRASAFLRWRHLVQGLHPPQDLGRVVATRKGFPDLRVARAVGQCVYDQLPS